MKTFLFLGIVLISGFSAGIIHGLVNLAVVEPYLETAIGIENRNMFASGEAHDIPQFWQEFNNYRMWQKDSSLLAGGMLGLSTGALCGLIFAYSRNALPSQNHIEKALVLAGIMWFTFFFIPFLRYPTNSHTSAGPDTILFGFLFFVILITLFAIVFF